MSKYLIRRLADMKPYTPGEQPRDRRYIKLNTNESPYPPSPRVIAAISKEQVGSLQLYPDPEASTLVETLAKYYGVNPNQVFVGNGSDEILAFFFIAFCDGEKKVCFPDITYGFYKVYASLFGVEALRIPLKEDLSIDVEDYLHCGRNIIIANPNAPTGLCLPLEDIERILQTNPEHLVLIDEAYIDFGGTSCLSLLPKYDNLLICGTFSKSRALAGARSGYAIASPEVIEDLNKIKFSFNPYNVNRLTQLAGAAALEDKDYFEDCRAKIITTREDTARRLKALGFHLTDSKANFLFARHQNISGEECYSKLKQRGILVRHFGDERIRDYVRITIGSPEEMEELIKALVLILKEEDMP